MKYQVEVNNVYILYETDNIENARLFGSLAILLGREKIEEIIKSKIYDIYIVWYDNDVLRKEGLPR